MVRLDNTLKRGVRGRERLGMIQGCDWWLEAGRYGVRRTEEVESRAMLSLRILKERLNKILNLQLKGEK